MTLTIPISTPDRDSSLVSQAIERVLHSTRLLALATVGEDNLPWINNSYFSFDEELNLYFLSPPTSRHCGNLTMTGGRVAVAVADSQQTGDGGKRGLQFSGLCILASGEGLNRGLASYRDRFPGTRDVLQSPDRMIAAELKSRLYVFSAQRFTLFDEETFGPQTWVPGDITRQS